jgi:hypothetical protein
LGGRGPELDNKGFAAHRLTRAAAPSDYFRVAPRTTVLPPIARLEPVSIQRVSMQAETTPPGDAEDWLHFFYKNGRRRTPVRISRQALETCFRSAAGESLINLYVANVLAIEERVRARLKAAGPAAGATLLSLDAGDFEEQRLARYADLVSSPVVEKAARELAGRFTADELEAVALWMRSRSRAGG